MIICLHTLGPQELYRQCHVDAREVRQNTLLSHRRLKTADFPGGIGLCRPDLVSKKQWIRRPAIPAPNNVVVTWVGAYGLTLTAGQRHVCWAECPREHPLLYHSLRWEACPTEPFLTGPNAG